MVSVINILDTISVAGILSPQEEESKDKIVAEVANAANGEKSLDFKAGIVGEIRMGVWTVAPAGWLLCNGALYDTSTNPDYGPLFDTISALGFPWNTGGETATQFRVPNMDGKIAYGAGSASPGDLVGANTKDLQHAHSMPHDHGMEHDHDTTPHTHPFSAGNHNHGNSVGTPSGTTDIEEGTTGSVKSPAGGGHDHVVTINNAAVSGDTDADTGDNTSGSMAVGTANPKVLTDETTDPTGLPTSTMAASDVRQASYAFTFIIKW
jgi:microcystin-dependent protein